jgi:LPXTG-site transpeptidase (sortase) family protein
MAPFSLGGGSRPSDDERAIVARRIAKIGFAPAPGDHPAVLSTVDSADAELRSLWSRCRDAARHFVLQALRAGLTLALASCVLAGAALIVFASAGRARAAPGLIRLELARMGVGAPVRAAVPAASERDVQVAGNIPGATTAASQLIDPSRSSVRIRIPAIGVDAAVQRFSIDADGQMQVPHDADTVAWYDFSAVAGAPGNALMAGHVDWGRGEAVFWALSALRKGDQIVVSSTQKEAVFAVEKSYSVPYDSADTASIVGSRMGAPTLTLITCSGPFDRTTHQYEQRLIVVASLQSG